MGLDAFLVTIEADLSTGLPSFAVVGLPDASIKESRNRVKSALKNCEFDFPVSRITINLAPADVKKEGSIYDLPINCAAYRLGATRRQPREHSFYRRNFLKWRASAGERRSAVAAAKD